MEIIAFNEFMVRTFGGWPVQMDLSIYDDIEFECACGKKHVFTKSGIKILRELSGMKLVIACPNEVGITCIKIKGIFKYKFVSLFGTLNEQEQN
jgi:hypothetical protein